MLLAKDVAEGMVTFAPVVELSMHGLALLKRHLESEAD